MIPASGRARRILLAVCLVFLTSGSIVFAGVWFRGQTPSRVSVIPASPTPSPTPVPTDTPTPTLSPTPVRHPDIVLHDVPFTVQAPRRQWDQDIYQYACEEASILMAMGWVIGRAEITTEDAEREITDIAHFAQEYIGTFYDESAADTLRLFQAYYDHDQLELLDTVTAEDIRRILYDGKIAILPMNGQILQNPFYTSPGPVEHMLVVIGYDRTTDEFITNDPGISNGRHWRYDAQLFEQAIQDYPTGHKEPIPVTEKRMIVVGK